MQCTATIGGVECRQRVVCLDRDGKWVCVYHYFHPGETSRQQEEELKRRQNESQQ